MTNRANSLGFSATVVSLHCWRSSDTFAGSPATTRARDGSFLQDAVLQQLRRAVGVAAGQQRHHLGARRQAAGHPEHAHRHDGAVLVGLELLDEPRQHSRRRVVVGRAARSTSTLESGCSRRWRSSQSFSSSSSAGDDTDASTSASSVAVNGANWSAGTFTAGPSRQPFSSLSWRPLSSPVSSRRLVLAAAFLAGRLLRGLLRRRLLRRRLLPRCTAPGVGTSSCGQSLSVSRYSSTHLGDALGQVVVGPVVDRDRRVHHDVDGAGVEGARVACGDDLRVANHDGHDRDSRRHRDAERALLERADLGGVQPGALRRDEDRQALARELLDLLQSFDGLLGVVAVDEGGVHDLAHRADDRIVLQLLLADRGEVVA